MTDTVDDFLAHFGVKGMHWGVRREKSTPRLSRREKLEAAYSTKMSSVEAKTKANARIKVEKTLAIVGAVAVTTAIAVVVGKKLHTEFAPVNLVKDTVLQNINQQGKGLDLNKVTFASFKKKDNQIYRKKFTEELLRRNGRTTNTVFATELKAVKDLKIPSKAKTRSLFKEWEESQGRGLNTRAARIAELSRLTELAKTSRFPQRGKVRLPNVTTRMINNNRSQQVSTGSLSKDSFLSFVASRGYDGVQDVMDQRRSSYNAKLPLMFVNGAQALVVKGHEVVNGVNSTAALTKDLLDPNDASNPLLPKNLVDPARLDQIKKAWNDDDHVWEL